MNMAEGGNFLTKHLRRSVTGNKKKGHRDKRVKNTSLDSSVDSNSTPSSPALRKAVSLDKPPGSTDIIVDVGNGQLVKIDGNGTCTSANDIRLTPADNQNRHSDPQSNAYISDKTIKVKSPDSEEEIHIRLLRHYDQPSKRNRDRSKRQSLHQETLAGCDLTGRASLSAKDLIFGIPSPPARPPRLPKDNLRKAYSTPNINKKGSSAHDSERKPRSRTVVVQDDQPTWPLSRGGDDDSATDSSESAESFMEWSDDDTSLGSASSPSPKYDAYENLNFAQPSTNDEKAHHIAKELLTTESSYVKKLEILNKARTKTTEILGHETAKEMFPYINSIYALHKDNMLPHLKCRLEQWKTRPEIGDVMKTFSPFLKLYTDYVKNFDAALKLVDTWNTKSPDFAKMLMSLPTSGPSLNLKVQIKSHMLEPIQRVPRYKLLLQQYSKEIKEDSPERTVIQEALTSVSEAAVHFEDMMRHGTMMVELMDLQRQVDCPINLMSTGRELVKQGKIGKVNAKTGKVVSRYVFLFNDLFMICSEQTFYIPGLHPKYKCRQLMEVEGMQITEGNNLDVPFTFYVKTRKKAVELCASDEEEKLEWQQELWRVVGDKMRLRMSTVSTVNRRRTMMLRAEGPLGKEAPVWVHNSQVTMCMTCASAFRGLKKKHHCRACGAVVCNRCSSHTAQMEYDDFREHRICNECYLILEENVLTTKREHMYKARARELCIEKGYLQVSADRGRSWQRRWFEVHEGGDLYCFKAQQDICPIMYASGAVPQMSSLDGSPGSKAIFLQLEHNKSYLLKEENANKLSRWFEALKKTHS